MAHSRLAAFAPGVATGGSAAAGSGTVGSGWPTGSGPATVWSEAAGAVTSSVTFASTTTSVSSRPSAVIRVSARRWRPIRSTKDALQAIDRTVGDELARRGIKPPAVGYLPSRRREVPCHLRGIAGSVCVRDVDIRSSGRNRARYVRPCSPRPPTRLARSAARRWRRNQGNAARHGRGLRRSQRSIPSN